MDFYIIISFIFDYIRYTYIHMYRVDQMLNLNYFFFYIFDFFAFLNRKFFNKWKKKSCLTLVGLI